MPQITQARLDRNDIEDRLGVISADTHALLYGRARKPLVRAVPDERYADMWRLAWPDGQHTILAKWKCPS